MGEKVLAWFLLIILGGTLLYVLYTNVFNPLRKPPS
ncbi:hypothetical protein Tph_c04610 [Thermacetogenium phaeum DSM 12270]|uniref:Uncharacterized protein n=1 Tax=Thermacetogenium phaeum (strain ATCC BAA-254 / DSM 26808 / PB) TaxID=1089553 RepID=K4LRI4_THEPS|nr:hypothetical protein Tph_c04610 [Thermacetogenium phaeum DSM 12270]